MPEPDKRRAHHTDPEPSEWEKDVYNDHIAGKSYRELGELHECSYQTIKRACDRVSDWRRPQISREIERTLVNQLAAHTAAYQEALKAWNESRGEKVVTTRTERNGVIETKTIRTYSAGDAKHLNNALAALKAYRLVLGYQPPRPDDEAEHRVGGKSFDDVIARELSRLNEIRTRQLDGPSRN